MTTGLFFAANLLFCLAYVVRDMACLRAITIIAAFCTLPYFYFQATPLYSAMGWQGMFIAINAFNLTVLLLQRRPVLLDQRQSWLHQHTFRMLPPREMLKILHLSISQHCEAGETLVQQGEQLDRLILILDGAAQVHADGVHRASLQPGDLVGEMSFVTGDPASADVIASEPLDYLIWYRRDLETLYERSPGLKDAMQNVIGADMAQKLTRYPPFYSDIEDTRWKSGRREK
ncbi:cyclic nucleotide-binding domain-containing protein [Billgrantia endophytica]|nr:cyclic nucleotide-binding domain-containing protein [Halomonas endophytica]